MILLDIQKAFDSVDHQILCNKLSAMGIQSTAWFHSYLSDRKQIVHINGVESDPLANTCGVPQGSILGPLLFLCYVNDMPNSVNCLMLQYADDSALIFSDTLVLYYAVLTTLSHHGIMSKGPLWK